MRFPGVVVGLLAAVVLFAVTAGLQAKWRGFVRAETLTGEFVWEGGGDTERVDAVFVAGEGPEWEVGFYFTFRGQSYEYHGTAEGYLDRGLLTGIVESDDGHRSFRFSGFFDENGTFRGNHRETGRRETYTGTLTLRRSP